MAQQPVIARTIGVGPPAASWAKVIDQTKCIGCHACTTACKSENRVPLSVTRTFVKSVDVGAFPQARRAFQITRCNQCVDAPCVAACPTSAMYTRPDGIVDFDKQACIGCKACMAACPYDAIFINPDDHCAEKCNFCAHRLEMGLEPACVVVCPTQAIMVGDLSDPDSEVARIVGREPVTVRRPGKGTRPKLFYQGATELTLDPLAADRPPGGIYAWSEQPTGHQIVTGPSTLHNSSAAAVISYDVAHRAPWDWRVSLYTWTKGIAAGAYLVPLLLVLAGRLGSDDPLWTWTAPLVAAALLAVTAGLLVWDLEHPGRFFYILTRPQWRSWLVRGGVVLSGYAAVLGLHLLAGIIGVPGLRAGVAVAGLPLALGTAVYTAYLFAQAKGRDLWQNSLLPPHLAVQAVLAGAAVLLPVAGWRFGTGVTGALGWVLGGAALEHSVPGLPHAAAALGLTPLEYMRRYGSFEIRAAVGAIHEEPVPDSDLQDTAQDEFGRVYTHAPAPASPNVVPTGTPEPDAAGRRPVGVAVDGAIRRGFPTPSGKLEFYSRTLAAWGWRDEAVPGYQRSHVHPEAMDTDQMVLISTFRLPTQIHTRGGNAKWLDELAHTNPLWIHPSDAARLQVAAGDLVRVATEIGAFVLNAWVTEGIRPGVVACSHHMGRWKLHDQGQRQIMATVDLAQQDAKWRMTRLAGVKPYQSDDPDTARIWWTDVGVHQNLTFPVHPDPISGQHCWHQAVRVTKASPGEAYGDITVDTAKAHEVYQKWLALTHRADQHSPDGTRRPYWLMRPLKPAKDVYRLPTTVPDDHVD